MFRLTINCQLQSNEIRNEIVYILTLIHFEMNGFNSKKFVAQMHCIASTSQMSTAYSCSIEF